MSRFTYRKLSTAKVLELIDWAEANNVDYDVWNAEESIMGSETTELGLERWPESGTNTFHGNLRQATSKW